MDEGEDHEAMPIARTPVIDPRTYNALIAAGALGIIHAAFSLHWAAGGEVLAWSLGTDLLDRFRGREWLLAPIGCIKLCAALAPLMLARAGWPLRRLTRSACWAGAIVLAGWGGLNTVVAHLVLTGAIRPESGFDRAGMIGHAYLWDPLFLAWGVALAMGLIASRKRSTKAGTTLTSRQAGH